MEEKKTVFSYVSQLFATYGIVILIFVVFSFIIGEETGEYSSLFILGKKGLALATLLQMLLLSFVITFSQVLFLTGRWIVNMPMITRRILFFATIMIAMIVMAGIFGWFPLNDIKAWIGFVISFSASMFISIMLMRIEERENTKLQEALDKYKQEK